MNGVGLCAEQNSNTFVNTALRGVGWKMPDVFYNHAGKPHSVSLPGQHSEYVHTWVDQVSGVVADGLKT